jgi:hypothetical protein
MIGENCEVASKKVGVDGEREYMLDGKCRK